MESNGTLYAGNIVTVEPRSVTDKMKKWYKEKVIDTGASQNFEAKIDRDAKNAKAVIKVAGTVATVLLLVCPADGPFGELLTALATPGLCLLVDKITDMRKNTIIAAKRAVEKGMGFEGQGINPNVEGYTDLKQPIQDALSIRKSAEEVISNVKQPSVVNDEIEVEKTNSMGR